MERMKKFRFDMCETDPETGHLKCPLPEQEEFERQEVDPVTEKQPETVNISGRKKPSTNVELP